MAETQNIQRQTEFGDYRPSLSSLLLDRRGKLITEYFAEERREIVSVYQLPKYLLDAVITKEDRYFFSHTGFSAKGIFRAAWNIVTGHYFSGGSTISQQVAGNLYDDRSVTTLGRKFSELWWSFQLEKKRSKMEILEIYLNNSKFGHGNYGVESASQFYFGRPASDISLAEATLLTVQLSDPVTRSMINFPNRARGLQEVLIQDMADRDLVDREFAMNEFSNFWQHWEPARANDTSTHSERTDQAPAFSEQIRRRFEELFYGSPDLYRDGFTIHTGIDLAYQLAAESLLEDAVERQASDTAKNRELRSQITEILVPSIDLLGHIFDIDGSALIGDYRATTALDIAIERLVPATLLVDFAAGGNSLPFRLMPGGTLGSSADGTSDGAPGESGAVPAIVGQLVSIENATGEILVFAVAGAETKSNPSAAIDTMRNLGSLVGPIALAVGIDRSLIEPGTLLYDSPAYVDGDGGAREVINPRGFYRGAVSARTGVASSLATPLVTISERAGFLEIRDRLDRLFDGGFGPDHIIAGHNLIAIDGVYATPLQVAQAFSSFPRGGSLTDTVAIRYIEDRKGIVVYTSRQRKERPTFSSRTAFIAEDVLKSSLTSGNLERRVAEIGGIARDDFAAAAGWTLGWSDAWTVGFSREMTSVVWVGFDAEGDSLGQYQTGASVAGPVWMKFMDTVHADLPIPMPATVPTGIIERNVCAISGLLPTQVCNEGTTSELFSTDTAPIAFCNYHSDTLNDGLRATERLLFRIGLEPTPDSILNWAPVEASDPTGAAQRDQSVDDRNPFLD